MKLLRIKPVRVKAFTILEISASMAVSAIVIMITYTAYRIISRGYMDFNKKNNDLEMFIRLDHLLKRDFDRAALIIKTSKGLLIQDNNSKIIYELMENSIVRKSSIIDTFNVKINAQFFTFEGSPVNGMVRSPDDITSEVFNSDLENSRIDQLDLLLDFKSENLHYTYQKLYSSTNLMQRKANAIH